MKEGIHHVERQLLKHHYLLFHTRLRLLPHPEGPWVTIQLQKANYITTWKGDELSFNQAKELKLSMTWGQLNIFYNTPLFLFAFSHHHLRVIWTRSPITYPRLAPIFPPPCRASGTGALQTQEHCITTTSPHHTLKVITGIVKTLGYCPIPIHSLPRRWREQTLLSKVKIFYLFLIIYYGNFQVFTQVEITD